MREKIQIPKWKLLLLGIGAVFFVLRMVYIFTEPYVPGSVQYDRPVEPPETNAVSFTSLSQTFTPAGGRLNSIELLFADIPAVKDGTEPGLAFTLEKQDGSCLFAGRLLYSKLSEDGWTHIFLNLPAEAGQPYRLTLTAENPDAGAPRVCLTACAGEEPCFLDGAAQNQTLAMRCGCPVPMELRRRLRSAGLRTVCFTLTVLVLLFWERLWPAAARLSARVLARLPRRAVQVGLAAAETMLCLVVMDKSDISFQWLTRLLLLVLSILSFRDFEKKTAFAKARLRRFPALFGFLLLDLYAAFALIGNRRLVYPLERYVGPKDLCIYLLTAVWFAPIVLALVYHFCRFTVRSPAKRFSTLTFSLSAAALLLLPASFALYAFNPGMGSHDSTLCLTVAHALRGAVNWHPPFYSLLLKGVLAVWDSTYAVVLAQWAFWLYVMLELLFFLRRQGLRDGILLGIAAGVGASPVNFMYLCTAWKDTPFVITCLWLTVLAAKLTVGGQTYRKRSVYIELAISLTLLCLLRQNGIVPYLLFSACALAVLRRDRRLRRAVLFSALFVAAVVGPLYSWLDIQPAPVGNKYAGLGNDILSVYYAGGEIEEETLPIIDDLAKYDPINLNHHPYFYIYVEVPFWRSDMLTFLRQYCVTAIHNPVLWVRAVFCRMDLLWDFFEGLYAYPNQINMIAYVDTSVLPYPPHVDTPVTPLLTELLQWLDAQQLFHCTVWLNGFHFFALLLSLFAGYLKSLRKEALLPYLPAAGLILGLLLSSGWSEVRYYWPISLIAVFLVALILALPASHSSVGGEP